MGMFENAGFLWYSIRGCDYSLGFVSGKGCGESEEGDEDCNGEKSRCCVKMCEVILDKVGMVFLFSLFNNSKHRDRHVG